MFFCQACNRPNPLEADHCKFCGHKLLVVSGDFTDEDHEVFDSRPEEQVSLDEHLLERVSILEEVVKRTAQGLRHVYGSLRKLEQKILVCETGVTSLRELLERSGQIDRQDWSELWERRLERQLLALEKRDRFAAARERIAGLYEGTERGHFRSLLEGAHQALAALEIDRALGLLEQAMRLDPKNHELSFFLGETFFNEGRSAGALRYFVATLRERQEHFESLVYCGVLFHQEGDAERAEDLLRHAATLYPDTFLPAFSLGAIAAGAERWEDALVYLEHAAASGDAVPAVFYLLASCCFELGQGKKAVAPLEQALLRDPTFADAHFLLGLASLERGHTRKALAALKQSLRLDPLGLLPDELFALLEPRADEPALRGAAAALAQGDAEAAAQALRGLSGAGDPRLLVAHAIVAAAEGRRAEVAPQLRRALESGADEGALVAGYATLAEAWRAEGRERDAATAAEQLLAAASSPLGRAVARGELALSLAGEERLERARELAAAALAEAPAAGRRFALEVSGWVLFLAGQPAGAVDCLSQSNDLGSNARTLTRLGMALLAAGRKEAARPVLERARTARERAGGLHDQVLKALKESTRLLQDPAQRIESRNPKQTR
jgi:tetratricopeptide (TPR) repeat protein